MGNLFSAKCTSTNTLHGKTVIVTGASSGIGKETAKDFYERGARVYLACRNLEKTEAAMEDIKKSCCAGKELGELKIIELNLTNLASIRSCARKLLETEEKIDILVNNAGVMMCPFARTDDGFELQIGTNHLGHFLFTLLLLPKIHKGAPARIVNVSSMAHAFGPKIDFDDLNWEKRRYNSLHAYQQSKLSNILFTKELARKLKEKNIDGINIYVLHPGVIRTELSRHMGSTIPGMTWIYNNIIGHFIKSPVQGAQTQIHCAVSNECATETGLYYAECRVVPSNADSNNEEYARMLWNVSLELVGVKEEDVFKFVA